MARTVRNKELSNTRLAANYGGWMYCENCGENIGYLCYATYDRIRLQYKCNCGSTGCVLIDFDDSQSGQHCDDDLAVVRNRFCCPNDNEPLITILDNKVAKYELQISCKTCGNIYEKIK